MGQLFSAEEKPKPTATPYTYQGVQTAPSRPSGYSSSYSTGTTASTVRPATTTQARTSSSAYSSNYSAASTSRPTTTTQARTPSSAYPSNYSTTTTVRPTTATTRTPSSAYPSTTPATARSANGNAAFPSAARQPTSTIRSTTSTARYATPATTIKQTTQASVSNAAETRRLIAKRAEELLKAKRADEAQRKADDEWRASFRGQHAAQQPAPRAEHQPAASSGYFSNSMRPIPIIDRQMEAERQEQARKHDGRCNCVYCFDNNSTEEDEDQMDDTFSRLNLQESSAKQEEKQMQSKREAELKRQREAANAYSRNSAMPAAPMTYRETSPTMTDREYTLFLREQKRHKRTMAGFFCADADNCRCGEGGDYVTTDEEDEEQLGDAFARMNMQDRPSVLSPSASSGYFSPVGSRFIDDFVVDSFIDVDGDSEEKGIPMYVLAATQERVCVFEPGREKFVEVNRAAVPLASVTQGDIYHATSLARNQVNGWSTVSALRRQQYVNRAKFVYGSASTYRELILPALILGSRVRDYEQRCATVNGIGPLVLNMPAQNRRLKTLKLKTSSGITFSIDVQRVHKKDEDKRWTVVCYPPKPEEPLPMEVRNGALLELQDGYNVPPRVTFALLHTHCNKKSPITNWPLLSCIYGAPAKKAYPAVPYVNPSIPLGGNKGNVTLNPEQVEAVARYNCGSCPAFVVESPPGSGKTMTAAAMAVSYTDEGVQLFLSTANVPVINMALALAKLDYGSLKAIHFISSEREELLTEETRSPFSVLSLAKAKEKLTEVIELHENELKYAKNEVEKDQARNALRKACGPVFADKYDVFFATVDMILGRMFKKGSKNQKDSIQKQLNEEVRRVVVDEASQLTESALNALILCFPKAQIVLIGDSKQLPPFRYERGDVISELAARSALEVIKDKNNLPVIKLSRVYRASPKLMAHYSDVFYGGALVSGKPETQKNLLACFGARSSGYRALFWQTKGYQKQSGTSKFNDGEITCLKYILNILRSSGHDEKDVMIISYYEAQRKKAEEELQKKGWEGYEVLTVDSAQGREKKIVIVMTTRTSVPTDKGAFFSCPLRCNVAVSRHQEALIVLGNSAIASAPNWSKVLSPKYFRHVPPYSG